MTLSEKIIIIIIRTPTTTTTYNVDFMKWFLSIHMFPLPPGLSCLSFAISFRHCMRAYSLLKHKMGGKYKHANFPSIYFSLTRSKQTTNIKSITCNIIQITTTRCTQYCIMCVCLIITIPKNIKKKPQSLFFSQPSSISKWNGMIKAQK